MNIFSFFVFILGGPGETYVESWGGGGGAGGGGGFNIQTGPILVHIYPPFNNNLHVKYRSNLIRTFWVKIKNMNKNKLI